MGFSTASLEALPVELKHRVFTHLSSVYALVSLVLSSRACYEAFLGDQQRLCSHVVRNHIGNEVVTELITAWRARKLTLSREKWSNAAQKSFFEHITGLVNTSLAKNCTLSEALGIARLYKAVQNLAEDCAQRDLAAARDMCKIPHLEPPPSRSERGRIERAFCRCELFSAVFAKCEDPLRDDYQHQRALFWTKSAPWENEQLACVYDYLYRRLCDAFRNLAMNDNNWTANISSLGGINETLVQLWLSRGIELTEAFLASDWVAQSKFSICDPESRPALVQPLYLSSGLRNSVTGQERFNECLKEMDQEHEIKVISKPALNDPNSAAEGAWRWSHQDEFPISFNEGGWVLSENQMQLREVGYVFWDQARIDRWGLLVNTYEANRGPADLRSDHEFELKEEIDALAQSLLDQGKIFL